MRWEASSELLWINSRFGLRRRVQWAEGTADAASKAGTVLGPWSLERAPEARGSLSLAEDSPLLVADPTPTGWTLSL